MIKRLEQVRPRTEQNTTVRTRGSDRHSTLVRDSEPRSLWLRLVLLIVVLIYIPMLFSPPHLTDDTDATQAQIPRNMLVSGDWVTARLDGVPFLEKSPMLYWMIGASYIVLGQHDWAARMPIVLSILGTCWMIGRMGRWAFDGTTGVYSALVFGTSVGVFLFTRILIPDLTVTGTIALSLWAFARALDEEEPRPRKWAAIMAVSAAVGVLLKGVIALLFPAAAGFLFLILTGRATNAEIWK